MNRKKLIERTNRNIRCLCGKLWGIKYFRLHQQCDRCKTYVIARGHKGNRLEKGDVGRAVKSGMYKATKDGRLTGY